ncbi:hypothetical protein DSECCO2_647970 [anaerobic digester metagenome]
MEVPHTVQVVSPLDDQDRPWHRVGHGPHLPEEVPLDEGIHEVLHGLSLDEDAVAYGIVAEIEALDRYRRPEFVQALDDPRRHLAVVDDDRRPGGGEREDIRLPGGGRYRRRGGGNRGESRNGVGSRNRCNAHIPDPLYHRPLPGLAHVAERLVGRALRHQDDDRAAAAPPGPPFPLDAPDL